MIMKYLYNLFCLTINLNLQLLHYFFYTDRIDYKNYFLRFVDILLIFKINIF